MGLALNKYAVQNKFNIIDASIIVLCIYMSIQIVIGQKQIEGTEIRTT